MLIEPKIFEKNRNFNGAKGLVFINDKIIIYRRDTKTESYPLFIDLPGGAKEENESAFETFKREVKEEFNITIEKDDLIYAKQYTSSIDPSKESYFIVTATKESEEDIIFGDEGIEYFLIKIDDYLKLNDSIPKQKEKVIEYMNHFSDRALGSI